jgi:O-antigen ligase
MSEGTNKPMRPVIVATVAVCVAVAMAPWFSGGQEPVAMLVSGLALLLGVLLVWRQPEARLWERGPLSVSWLALVGLAGLSWLWSVNHYSTVLWLVDWVMAGIAFWLAFVLAGERSGREWLIRAYMLSAGLFSLVALVMFFASSYPRLTGTFYWPNPAAAYLMPAILIGLDRTRRSIARTTWGWMAATAGLLAMFALADSRAATLVLVVFAAIYWALVKETRVFWIKIVCTLIVATVIGSGLSWLSTIVAHHRSNFVPGSRFGEVAVGEPSSLKDRLEYVESGFEIWWRHPIGGSGAGTYGDIHPQYQHSAVSASRNVHNLYVQTLAELGLAGAMALLTVGVCVAIGSLRGMVRKPEMLPVFLGAGAVLVHFGLDIDATYPSLLMLVAILLGLVYSQGHGHRGIIRVWAPAVTAALLVPLVSLYQSSNWADKAQSAQLDGNYAEAANDYAAAGRWPAYNPDYVNAEGIDWYSIGGMGGEKGAQQDLALALDRARQAQKLDPDDGQHYQLEGRVLAARRDFVGAQHALQKALQLDPFDHPGYALDLATFQVLAGERLEAVRSAEAMLALYPPKVVNNRNTDQTIKPTLANLEALIGNVDLQNGDLIGAGRAAKQALAFDPQTLRGKALEVQVKKKLASN